MPRGNVYGNSTPSDTPSAARMNRTLVIMAKAPRLGSVKTRLAKSLPLAAVTELYRCFLNDTLVLAQALDDVEVALMCPAADVEDLACAVPEAVRVVPQGGNGLAAALASVFTHFTQRGRQRVIAFNSDSPHLPALILENAFDALATCDLVVGPTHDGGYYLVGATASHPGLFDGDRMGTVNALEALLQRASSLKLSVRVMDPFYDIDVAADLNQLAEELERTPEKAPRTAAWLMEWRRALAENSSNIGAP
jgi:rSAM/selenodomain-associated transferase 1